MFNKFVVVVIVAFAFCVSHLNAEACVSCSSKDEPKCAQHPEQIAPKQCTSTTGVSCYTRIVDGETLRGCTDEMDQGVVDKCNKNDTNDCSTCRNFEGHTGCNKDIFPEHRIHCHMCTGDLNSNCSKSIDVNPTVCRTYLVEDKCYIHKTSKGVERGCLSDSSKCNNQTHCYTCDGNGCNNKDSNSTEVPFAPSSAAIWKYSTVFVTILIAYTFASFI